MDKLKPKSICYFCKKREYCSISNKADLKECNYYIPDKVVLKTYQGKE